MKNKLQHDESMWKGASPDIFSKAQDLRSKMTNAEVLLWDQLASNKFRDLKFRRQHPLLNYIVDFYCHELKLVIEIDGEYHQNKEQIKKDKERTEHLNFNDLHVIRFKNSQVENNIEKVLNELEDFISSPFRQGKNKIK